MRKNWTWGVLLLTLAVILVNLPVFAQESAVKGNISGTVEDKSGAVVPGAQVSLTGPTGTRTVTTGNDGRFAFLLIAPASYSLKVEKAGFSVAAANDVVVETGRTTALAMTLQPGVVTETVEVSGTAVTVDTTSTAVGADLSDQFYQQVPVARNVSGLFYVAPGAADSGRAGRSNPSISGASGLENLYVADGVNITDSAFGGLGVFTRGQGSIGSGINLSFIKEVNVKTSGFEPQYGQADGGLVQLVTKSGSNAFHGEIGVYAAPQGAEASYLQSDTVRSNKAGLFLHRANYDVDGELGGYIPGFKNHLFFFGDFDPTWNQTFLAAPKTSGNPPVANGQAKILPNGLVDFARVYNYAGKLTWKISEGHQIESSVFGDPTNTNNSEQNLVLNAPNLTTFSQWNYGTRNFVVRYNGTLSQTWLVNGSFTWNNNRFTETPQFPNVFGVTDRTVATNIHALQGVGFLENHSADTYGINFDTQKIVHYLGTHTFSLGYSYQRPNYGDVKTASGGRFPVPSTNASGGSYLSCKAGDPTCPLGQTEYLWSGGLRLAPASCTLCPLYPINGVMTPIYVRFSRGEFDPSNVPSFGRYHAGYFNDAWQWNDRITLDLGLRWEQWHMEGTGSKYTFTDNWAPRIGVAVDPFGSRKTKIYGNFGRYNYQTPLDAALRSLSSESDVLNVAVAPISSGGVATINPNGSLNLVVDSAHLLNKAAGGVSTGVSVGASGIEGFAPGAKLQYQDEFVGGADHEFKNGLVLSARFVYRTIPRVLEDVAGISPEGYVNNPFETQNYFITNPGPGTDLFPNEHETSYNVTSDAVATAAAAAAAGCSSAAVAAGTAFNLDQIVDGNGGTINPQTGQPWNNGNGICWKQVNGNWGGEIAADGGPLPDGVADGFPQVRHIYKAVEIEANKAFSHNWMLRFNYRIASLSGNYEGAFRNDNGQTDPSISSLFDFTNGIIGMLGDQYKPGPLNTDRRHIVNLYTSYVVPTTLFKNTELGAGVSILSGTPISQLANHPAYTNAGEVPLGGRGSQGRTPISGGVNLHVDRPFRVTEKTSVHLSGDFFNVGNQKPVTLFDQNYQISGSPSLNPDFIKPAVFAYQRPFYARFQARFVF